MLLNEVHCTLCQTNKLIPKVRMGQRGTDDPPLDTENKTTDERLDKLTTPHRDRIIYLASSARNILDICVDSCPRNLSVNMV